MASNPHARLQSIFDQPVALEWDHDVASTDPLGFPGYQSALMAAQTETGFSEAVITGPATIDGHTCIAIVCVFEFLGGTMGVAAGERIARAFEEARYARLPVISVLSTGGARMQEGMVALSQMPKTVVAQQRHRSDGLAHISIFAHPTTGGMFASFGSLADVRIGEAGATVAFAGPRVAEQVLGRPREPGAGTAESAFAHGQLDAVMPVTDMRPYLANLISILSLRKATPKNQDLSPSLRGGVSRRSNLVRDLHRRESSYGLGCFASLAMTRGGPDTSKAPSQTKTIIEDLFDSFVRLRGDQYRGDDSSIVAGIGDLDGRPVALVAQDRHSGADGRTVPAGFGLAMRVIRLAEQWNLPLITMVDTPGADPSEDSEAGGIATAIANTMATLLDVQVPVISICIGEGGSGGALALACGNVLYMFPESTFSVIAPAAAATILHRDASQADQLADQLKISAQDLVDFGLADAVVSSDSVELKALLASQIDSLIQKPPLALATQRQNRWRSAGHQFLK